MKKILTWMTLLCMLLSFAALAEEPTVIDPFADEAPAVEETTEDETTGEAPALAVPDNYPDGQELYAFDTGANPDWGTITVGEVNYEVLEARDADQAEGGTMRITAKRGTRLIAFRLYFHPFVSGLTYDEAFDAKIQVGEELYACRKYVESGMNGSIDARGQTIALYSGYNTTPKILPYLVGTDGRTETIEKGNGDPYYLFDAYTLVPEETLTDNVPVFLILKLGEKQFWVQVQ